MSFFNMLVKLCEKILIWLISVASVVVSFVLWVVSSYKQKEPLKLNLTTPKHFFNNKTDKTKIFTPSF